uniref:Protein FAM151A n=1 Tax=Sphaeramia orbicularis TaxID=375764 RepID=A0A673BDR6_9TELE
MYGPILTYSLCSSVSTPSFATGGDMLDYLIQSGDISHHDGLLATWFHRANNKAEMNKALASDVMILEADVTLEGYGTPNVAPIPIMAHPPDIYSDNTLDQWLDAVLSSKKGIKLDFKNIESVGLSLDLLRRYNNSRGINRPVWLNADILRGPSVPVFLELVNQKFPDVTLSTCCSCYLFLLCPDCFSRFSLTLWQGPSIDPTVSDLLFVRDNTHPARVYYDIYEPTLSAFKEAASKKTQSSTNSK